MDRTIIPAGLADNVRTVRGVNKDVAKIVRLNRQVHDAVADLLMAHEAFDYDKGEVISDLKAKAAEGWGVSKGSMDNKFPAGWFLVTAVKEVKVDEDPHALDGCTLKVTLVLRSGKELLGAPLIDYIKDVRKYTGKKYPADVVRNWIQRADGDITALKTSAIAFEEGLKAQEAKADPRPTWVGRAAESLTLLPDNILELDVSTLAPLMAQIQRLSGLFQAQVADEEAKAKAEKALA